jgi:hypothetical protein
LPWEEIAEALDVVLKPRPVESKAFITELRERNFPPAGEKETCTTLLISGQYRGGKSTTAAKLIIGSGDKTYLPSLRYHPANGGHSVDLWKCHINSNPDYLIQAFNHELDRVKAGLPTEYLHRGSWWHIDEPSKVKSTEWWAQSAKDAVDTVLEAAFMGINVVICTNATKRVLGGLREMADGLIRQYRPGVAMLHKFKRRLNYKSASLPEIIKPVGSAPIVDDYDPKAPPNPNAPQFKSDPVRLENAKILYQWYQLYIPIKVWNAQYNSGDRMVRLTETRRKRSQKVGSSVESMRRTSYVG